MSEKDKKSLPLGASNTGDADWAFHEGGSELERNGEPSTRSRPKSIDTRQESLISDEKLSKLVGYDTVVVVDDSSSMNGRVDRSKEGSITRWELVCTILNPSFNRY